MPLQAMRKATDCVQHKEDATYLENFLQMEQEKTNIKNGGAESNLCREFALAASDMTNTGARIRHDPEAKRLRNTPE